MTIIKGVKKLIDEAMGQIDTMTTEDAIAATTQAIYLEGLFPCPEVGTSIEGLRKALAQGMVTSDEKALIMSTGSGLKSVPVFPTPKFRTVEAGGSLSP